MIAYEDVLVVWVWLRSDGDEIGVVGHPLHSLLDSLSVAMFLHCCIFRDWC